MVRRLLAVAVVVAAISTVPLKSQVNSSVVQSKLAKEIRHELVMLPYYNVFDNLAFKVDGSRVTLLGQVVRPTLKSDAERAVKGIEGVESVDNRIEVLPLSPNDDRLRIAAFPGYLRPNVAFRGTAIQSVPPIHIIVKNGK